MDTYSGINQYTNRDKHVITRWTSPYRRRLGPRFEGGTKKSWILGERVEKCIEAYAFQTSSN